MQERKVAPPDLPDKQLYHPLGELLQQVQQGTRFLPITLAQIRGTAPAPTPQSSSSQVHPVCLQREAQPCIICLQRSHSTLPMRNELVSMQID